MEKCHCRDHIQKQSAPYSAFRRHRTIGSGQGQCKEYALGRHHLRDGEKHRQRLTERFPAESAGKNIIILDIEDNYQYMDPELIDILKASIAPHIEEPW